MRKYLLCLLLAILALSYNVILIINASGSYARATESIHLYKLGVGSNELQDIICIVEKSYFVEIISDNGTNYKVNYNGVSGYVKKTDVKLTTTKPNTPYPYNIQIVIGSDCNLRKTPTTQTTNSNILTSIKADETDLTFIGRVFSDEAIDFGGTTWYYVEYQGEYGYIYNKYVKSISSIYENNEVVSLKDETISHINNPITHAPSLIIIIILLIPCIIILFILYFPRKITKREKSQKLKKSLDKY